MTKRHKADRGRMRKPSVLTARMRDAEQVGLLGALDLLRQRRAPYSDLLTGIVAETLEGFPPLPGRPIVEIGAGAGQLRDWLPLPLRIRTLHTDPSLAALRTLVARAPDARAAVARAQHLPVDAGACGAVLALCVFDALAERRRTDAVNELARVLGPGGRFVHFMDMATLLEAPFEKLAASGLIPIPNVFGDPADHDWPLDIVLLRRDWLNSLWDFAARTGHPLTTTFASYFSAFLLDGPRFDVNQATNHFKAVASNGAAREALSTLLGGAARLAFQFGLQPLDPLPFHSGKYLASVLDTAFRQSGAFRVEVSEIRTKAVWQPALAGDATRYRSLCVGHQRIMDRIPPRLLAAVAKRESEGTAAEDTLVEAGVFVFVAERL